MTDIKQGLEVLSLGLNCFLTWQNIKLKNRGMAEKKGNRHFSGKRFYKSIKILVITLSVLLWLGALLQMQYEYNWKNNQMNAEIASCAQDIPNPNSTHYTYCTDFYNSVATNQITEVYFLAALGTLLPIIFYGGVAFIRYLFPVTSSEPHLTASKL